MLEPVERPTPEPGPGQVLIAMEACGICGAERANEAIERLRSGDVRFRTVLSMGH